MMPRYDKIFQFCNFNFLNTFRQSSPLKYFFFCIRTAKKSKARVCNIKFCNFIGFKGPLKYLIAKIHGCYPSAISLPVSQIFFSRSGLRQFHSVDPYC